MPLNSVDRTHGVSERGRKSPSSLHLSALRYNPFTFHERLIHIVDHLQPVDYVIANHKEDSKVVYGSFFDYELMSVFTHMLPIEI